VLKIFALLLLTLPVRAEIVEKDVTYEFDGEKYTGRLVYDDALEGPRPGVLVIHEWWGLSDYEKRRARMLAELGYVAFAADIYGTGKLTDDPEQAEQWMSWVTADPAEWRERVRAALDQLLVGGRVDPARVAAIGYCFGGATVLQAAYGNLPLAGVVSFHGALPAAPEEAKGKIGPRILAFHGAADPFVAPEVAAGFQAALEEAGADWEMVVFGGVRHSFTNPGADQRGMEALKYDADADLRSWAGMQEFFREIFAPTE
jgi:dienelactone hydrolase